MNEHRAFPVRASNLANRRRPLLPHKHFSGLPETWMGARPTWPQMNLLLNLIKARQ